MMLWWSALILTTAIAISQIEARPQLAIISWLALIGCVTWPFFYFRGWSYRIPVGLRLLLATVIVVFFLYLLLIPAVH